MTIPRRSRILLALACVLLALGVLFNVRGLGRLRAAQGRELFVFERVNERRFVYAGREVSVTDEARDGAEVVRLRFGDAEVLLRPSVPPGPPELPGLTRHESWMQLVRFAARRGLSIRELEEKIAAGEVADRLAIVTRSLRPGADPRTWGEVWRKDSLFDFYEFLPDGSLKHERLKYPTNRAGQSAREGELVEGTWQFDAALMVMPKGWVPKAQFRQDGWKAMGWTLPASMVSFLGFIALVVAAFSARRPESGPDEPAAP